MNSFVNIFDKKEVESFRDMFVSKLKADSRIVNGFMLDVSHISNHQIDTQFVRRVAQILHPYLELLSPDVFLTAAASGPGLTASIASQTENINVLYAKKSKQLPKIFSGREMLQREGTSPTKGDEFNFFIRKDLLTKYNSFLVVDDFLRSGKTLQALIDMGEEVGLELKGVFTLIAIKEGKIEFEKTHDCSVLSGITVEKIEGNQLFISEILSHPVEVGVSLPTFG